MDYNNDKIQNGLITDLKKFCRKFGAKETINSFEEEILSLNNARLSLFFSNIGGDLKRHGQIVLDSGDIELILEFVQDHFDDAQEQIDYIVNSGNAAYNFKLIEIIYEKCYWFVMQNAGTYKQIPMEYKEQLQKHIDAIIQSGDSEYCFKFIKWFMEHKNEECYGFAPASLIKVKEYVGKRTLGDLGKKVFEAEAAIIQGGNAKYNYLCAGTIRLVSHYDVDYAGHSKAIIESGDAEYNYLYARYYGYNVKAHGTAVARSNDPEYNYLFALNIKGADIEKHGKAIIKSKSLSHNYDFARNIEGADVLKHGKVIIDSKDAEYNYLFAQDIEGADIEAHSKVVLESKNPKYNYLFCMLESDEFDDYEHRIAVLESKDLEYNFLLADQFPEHELYEHHCDVIMCSGDEEYTSKIVGLKPNIVNAIKEKIRTMQA